MSNNQTQYSQEFLQQVEELKKEIERLSECVDDNTRKVLTQCTLKLNNARQDNLDKTIAEIKGTLGFIYINQGKIEQAKQHWLNIQENHDVETYAKAQLNLGALYHEQNDIEQAKQHWLNIQEKHGLKKEYAIAQFNLGVLYDEQGDIEQAKQHYQNIQEKHDINLYAMAQFNLGNLYRKQGDIEQAKQYWKNIQEKHNLKVYAYAQFNLAHLYHKQGDIENEQDKIEQAKRHYQNIQEKHNEEVYSQAQFNLGSILDDKRNVKNKINHYLQVKQKYVLEYDEILKFILKDYVKSRSQTVLTKIEKALNNNLSEPYLIYITRDIFSITHKKIKKDLILLLQSFIGIRYLLQVNNPNKEIYLFEDRVAHYAKPTLAETLLEKKNNNKFRIYGTAKMNDPTEGKILYQYFNYLFQQRKIFWTIEKQSEWATFIGCFTLNHDSLNQFRLYGKEDGQEATGVSIVFKPEFFAKTHQNVFYSLTSDIDFVADKINSEDKTLPLYRCIYLDPEKQIKDKANNKPKTYLKVAHRDEITFYRENNQGKGRDIDEWEKYKKEIEEIEKQVAENLENILKIMIDIFNLCENKKQNISEKEQTQAKSIIDLILLQLSCLVKHAAYQEEQECRVLKFLPFNDVQQINRDGDRLYTDYASIVDKVEKIYLSPGAKDYADIFRYMGVGKVELSSNPFRTAG